MYDLKSSKNLRQTVTLFAVIAALISGCRSTNDYKKLTEAGNKYAHAVNQLLTTAGDIRIEATSEQLLRDDKISNQSAVEYTNLSQLDDERLEIINDLRTHNLLLQSYFFKLQELTNSHASAQAKTEIEGIVTNLNKVSQKLRLSNLITNKSLFQGITNFVVDSQIRGALREELEKRNKTIFQELIIQQEMLNELGDSIEQDVELIKLGRERRLVVRPLTQPEPILKEEEWIQTRKNILTMDRKIIEFKNASATLGEFKEIFKASVEGKLSIKHLNNVLKDIDSFLASVGNNK